MDRKPVSIAIEGDREIGISYLPQAQQLLSKLRMQMEPGNISTSRAYLDLPDGYAYAVSAMGIDAIRIVVGAGASSLVSKFSLTHEPDFVSGVAVKAVVTPNPYGAGQTLQSFIPTAATARLHGLTAGQPQPITRLTVLTNSTLQSGASNPVAQIAELKPTMYSGSMKEVIQLLLGFGKQNAKTIYDKVLTIKTDPVSATPTSYQATVASQGLQVLYDYRFYRTHGISWSADAKPWLVEISQRNGVIAMPLPVHFVTTTTKFRDKLTLLGDVDGLAMLDRFGGYPTGEGFPATILMESAIRAGFVVRLKTAAELTPFYLHTAYSSAMGWAFNKSGSEAHNTGYRFAEDNIQTGVHYCVTMQFGMLRVAPALLQAEPVRVLVRNKGGNLTAILLKKCDWLTLAQIADVLLAESQRGAGIAVLDALTLTPIATANSSLSMSSEGRIYWPSRDCPQIKFNEPIVDFLLSHDMRSSVPVFTVPECNTTMHVFFNDDVLKVCKFVYTKNQPPATRYEAETEDCMYVGQWVTTNETDRVLMGNFYTTDFDDREELGGTLLVTTLKSRDIGYTRCVYGDDPAHPNIGQMTRVKTFRQDTKISIRGGFNRQIALAVPTWLREGYAYAKLEHADTTTDIAFSGYVELRDPYSYITWRNFGGYTGSIIGGIFYLADHPAGCGKVTRRTVWYEFFDEDQCSDLSNQGPWSKPCDDAEAMYYAITLPTLPLPKTTATPNKSRLEVWLVCSSNKTPLRTFTKDSTDPQFSGGFWFIPSPDPESGETAFMYATHNALGDGDALKYSPNINTSPDAVIGNPHYPLMETENTTFIGVVNA